MGQHGGHVRDDGAMTSIISLSVREAKEPQARDGRRSGLLSLAQDKDFGMGVRCQAGWQED